MAEDAVDRIFDERKRRMPAGVQPAGFHESDINAVLDGEDDTLVSVGSRQRRSSTASRRFSIAPSGRLSMAADGSFSMALEETEHVAPDQELTTPSTQEEFDLQAGEILGLPELQSICKADDNDFLLSILGVLKKLNVVDGGMNELVGQICYGMESQITEDVRQDQRVEIAPENLEYSLVLQQLLRSEDNESIRASLEQLAISHHAGDKYTLCEWIVSAVKLIEGPVAEKNREISNEIKLLCDLCDETERRMLETNTSAARKARRRRMKQEKVRRSYCSFVGSKA